MNKQQNWIVSADRWHQSFQQQFITVVGPLAAINLHARAHKHQTRATQL